MLMWFIGKLPDVEGMLSTFAGLMFIVVIYMVTGNSHLLNYISHNLFNSISCDNYG